MNNRVRSRICILLLTLSVWFSLHCIALLLKTRLRKLTPHKPGLLNIDLICPKRRGASCIRYPIPNAFNVGCNLPQKIMQTLHE